MEMGHERRRGEKLDFESHVTETHFFVGLANVVGLFFTPDARR